MLTKPVIYYLTLDVATKTNKSNNVYYYVGAGVVTAAILSGVAYYLLSKPAQAGSSLGVELRYESGVHCL